LKNWHTVEEHIAMTRSWRIGEHEFEYVRQVLESGFPGSASVSFVARLEAAFAAKFDCQYAISHTNGTATLHSALAAVGVQPGDEVIVPPLTMASTSLAVLHQRAIPVFADIDPDTFLIAPRSVRERITPRTKAIITVSLYGLSPDMDPILAAAREHGLAVIEDDAQCFLGCYKGRVVGSIGDLASFSFQNSKHITCGEGGIVTTNNLEYADRVARFASLGYGLVCAGAGKSKIDKRAIVNPGFKRHVSLGFNYRVSELCAAVTYAQLERLDEFVAWRKKTAAAFREVVNGCSWLKPQYVGPDYEHSYWAYVLKLDPAKKDVTWQQFYDKFNELGGEGFYGAWSLTHLEPVFQDGSLRVKYQAGICPVAEATQPCLIQLKTNYGDQATIDRQADVLAKTIRCFDA
jgi:perosamine synthetase